MRKVFAVKPAPGIGKVLAGAHFVDSYRAIVAAENLDAADVARSMLVRPAAWTRGLMAFRNTLVAPFGLKRDAGPDDPRERIGNFPIESATRTRVVLGFDDRHLDFRVVIDAVGAGGVREVTATTLVRLHGVPGRAYLAAILPFHKLIVRSMLSRVGKRGPM